ncbi:MAG: hypothetical protein AB7O24_04030 [Kofleriaceae bacterium]
MASTRRPRRASALAPRPSTEDPAPSIKPAAPPKKPMALARKVSLFEREVTVRLAPVAIDLLHNAARVLTEGDLVGNAYSGSTMLTIDLSRTSDRVSDPPDATTAQRVALLYAADERCRLHARRVAGYEAQRRAGCALTGSLVDIESRSRGPELHVSLNVEALRRDS